MNASAPTASPHSVTDCLYSLYAPSIPPQHKALFLALLDCAPCGKPNAEWIVAVISVLDTLIDPYNPLPDEARKARNAIRRACRDQIMTFGRKLARQIEVTFGGGLL